MPLEDSLLSALANIAGPENIRAGSPEDAVDEAVPRVVVTPHTVSEVAEIIAFAGREGRSVIPRGGGTMLSLGCPPEGCDLILSTIGLSRLINHSPADLVVTAEAGITIDALQLALRNSGQMLPIDPPFSARATLGGTLSANVSGPKRLLYGGIRDNVVGTRVVRPTGQIVKSGGVVVKNVSGYAMDKLYVGAIGTLGIVVEATFRLQPIPETEATVLATCPSPAVAIACAEAVRAAQLIPSGIAIVQQPREGSILPGLSPGVWLCAFCAEGTEPVVNRHVSSGTDLFAGAGGLEVNSLGPDASRSLWSKIRHIPYTSAHRSLDSLQAVCRLVMPVGAARHVFDLVARTSAQNCLNSETILHAGHGVAFSRLTTDADTDAAARLAVAIGLIRKEVAALGGFLVLESAPLPIKRMVHVWGSPETGELALQRALHQRFDPGMVVSPGRFVA